MQRAGHTVSRPFSQYVTPFISNRGGHLPVDIVMSGIDWTYHCRHVTSEEGGHVKAAYTARGTYLNPSTKLLEYKGRISERPLLIMYLCDFVEDDEFWDENCVLCDFATAVTEREKASKPQTDQCCILTMSNEN